MKKPKYYFDTVDAEICYTLDYHLDNAKMDKLSEIELFEAIPDKSIDYFYCKEYQTCGIKGDCGKHCDEYEPRNKISGICKHKGVCYTPGDKLTFKVN